MLTTGHNLSNKSKWMSQHISHCAWQLSVVNIKHGVSILKLLVFLSDISRLLCHSDVSECYQIYLYVDLAWTIHFMVNYNFIYTVPKQ